MKTHDILNFRNFYIAEFFAKVKEQISEQLKQENVAAIEDLINNLLAQDDVTTGIEKIAIEQGSSELSIFLFDIFDRIEDYPPTLVYDALPEVVDDFVNGLGLMIEEGDTWEAIQNVNKSFEESFKQGAEGEVKKELVENGKVVWDKEQKIDLAEQQEVEIETFEFAQFIELEFNDKIQNKLIEEFSDDEAAKFFYFSQIVRSDLDYEINKNTPQELVNLLDSLKQVFPWKIGQAYSASDVFGQLNQQMDDIINSIVKLDKDHPDILKKSLDEGKIAKPDVIKEKKFVREEIPKQPTTIDNLLSEYFQSDVDDFIDRFKQYVVDLQKAPDEITSVKEMITDFHAFKEICMIHGYVVLEQFCNDMLELLNEGLKDKKIVNSTALSYFDDVFDLLKTTEKLRDIREETEESKDLQAIQEKLSATFFITKQEEIEEHGVKDLEEKIEKIDFSDERNLASIFHDLLIETLPKIENYIKGVTNVDRVVTVIRRLRNGSQILGFEGQSQFLSDLNTQLVNLQSLSPDIQTTMLDLLFKTYESFVKEYSPDIEISSYLDRLKSLDQESISKKIEINFTETEQLNKILVEIEKGNLESFKISLQKIFMDQDLEERIHQQKHFSRLEKNLSLLERDDFKYFPQFYRQIIDKQSDIKLDQNALDEINQSYRLLIELLESGGSVMEIEEILSVLEEVLEAYSVKPEEVSLEEKEQASVVEEESSQIEAESDQEPEEDLEEIFKQEAVSDLTKVDSAIDNLKRQLDDYEQYKIIERSIHSLKSSARLMGQNTIADLAAPLEELCEKLSSNKYEIDETVLTNIEETIQALRMVIDGKDVNSEELIHKLQNIELVNLESEEDSLVTEQKGKDFKSSLEEKPLFSIGAEEDDDLLEIFKEESAENIKIIENANANLLKDFDNRDALKQLENACHSLKSAAKMLGFIEIGQISDAMEAVVVAIFKGEISNNQSVNNKMSQSIALIKDLTAGNKVNPESIDQILKDLDHEKSMGLSDQSKILAESDLSEDIDLFLQEAADLLEKINQDLVEFEKNQGDQGCLNNLSRNLHTLKGSSQIMQFDKIAVLAHRMEDYFEQFKASPEASLSADLDPIFKGVDELQNLIESLKAGKGEISDDYDLALSEIDNKLGVQAAEKVSTKQPKPEIEIEKTKSKKAVVVKPSESEQVIKISTNQLDQLVNMAAELVVNKTQLLNYLDRLKKIGETIDQDRLKLRATDSLIERFLEREKHEDKGPGSDTDKVTEDRLSEIQSAVKDFKEVLKTLDSLSSNFYSITQNFEQNIGQISNLTKHLHDDILQVRMVPTKFLFSRYPRAVRDLAKKQKKMVDLIIGGEDTEMDRAMIESLNDPVMHLIRNAVDHGIETPAERKKKGKDEKGILWLRARRDKNQVMIEVEDDGKGVDPEQIRSTIITKKLAGEEEVKKMNNTEILDYLFHPGFSTKAVASEISGRGIGLDVVAAQLQRLKGDIRISSEPDKGTLFSIRVPLTLAIAQAMLIKLADEVLAVPLTSVEETIQFDPSEIKEKDNKKFITIRDQLVPLVRLAGFLDYGQDKGEKAQKTITAIVIQESGSKYALIIDKVLHREEIVIKSMGEQLSKIPYLSGGTIFGDGSVALILDIPAIIRKVEMEFNRYSPKVREMKHPPTIKAEEEFTTTQLIARKKVTGRLPVALIIDDSLSVRKFVSSVLERNNYATVLASDGPEALSILAGDNFDIVITDLEMPKMHGFELIEKIREQEKFNELPIIILTGRVGKEHKDKGIELGANAYIVKPFKENDLVKTLENFIEYKKS